MSTQIYKPSIVYFENQEKLYRKAEDLIVNNMLDVTGQRGSGRLLLSGGSTPIRLYELLGKNILLPWEQIEVFQMDERYLPATNSDSNQFNIKQALGEDCLDRIKQLETMNTSYPLDMCLVDYSRKLESLDDEEELFDIAIVGIGEDGHIASLFPGGDYLRHQEKTVIATKAPEYMIGQQRISLSIETILSSQIVLVLLTGLNKAGVVKELMEGQKSAREYPAKFLLAHPSLHIYQSQE